MKKHIFLSVSFCAVFACFMTGCTTNTTNIETADQENQDDLQKYTETYLEVFDTVTDITGYALSEEEFEEQTNLLYQELQKYHQLFDIYNSYDHITNICDINASAGEAPVEVSAEILDLLEFGKEIYTVTDGQTNIAMGSVLSIWHEYRENGINHPEEAELPPVRLLEEAAEHINIEDLIIDHENSTVYFADPELKLDVGGIAKGYAVQKVTDYARELGIEHMLISVGGNVTTIGTKPDQSAWVVGIQNPDTEGANAYIQTVSSSDNCVVTSGDYQRYYEVSGVRYCHIIDPDTLMPADSFAAVSIIADDSGMADGLSTAIFNMTLEEGMELIDHLDNVEAMWVTHDGNITYSAGFTDSVT